jgi:hypothetical protein
MNAVDSGTKFNLQTRLAGSRSLEEFDEFFRELKNRVGGQVREVFERERRRPPGERRLVTFVSDGLGQYRRAFNRHFYRVARLVQGVPIACRQYGLRFNNNPIERHNQDIKQRYKTMRHFELGLGRGLPGPEEDGVQLREDAPGAGEDPRRSGGHPVGPREKPAPRPDQALFGGLIGFPSPLSGPCPAGAVPLPPRADGIIPLSIPVGAAGGPLPPG